MSQISLAHLSEDRAYKLSGAYLFYGARVVAITPNIEDRFRGEDGCLRQHDLEDWLALLCRNLAELSGLAPSTVFQRGRFQAFDIRETLRRGSAVDETAWPAELVARPLYLVFHGDGFNITWRAADPSSQDYPHG